MKAMKLKKRWAADLGRQGFCLNYMMSQRFQKNEWKFVQLDGVIYQPVVRLVYGEIRGVFFKHEISRVGVYGCERVLR